MIVQTESLAGFAGQGVALTRPLRLIVTSGGGGAGNRMAEDGKTPLRCTTVEVSGSGILIRYYFRPDGQLEMIDYPDDIQQAPSDESTIKLQFGGDRRMLPG
jgi:hypothetical protein